MPSNELYGRSRRTLPSVFDVRDSDSGVYPEESSTSDLEFTGTSPIEKKLSTSATASTQSISVFQPQRLQRQSQSAIIKGIKRTSEALLAHGNQRTRAQNNSDNACSVEYFKYTATEGTTQQRIIKLHSAAQDPLEPSKIRQKKAPSDKTSPPGAILHSPPRSLDETERAQWQIPPAISNWKNSKGFTIPLDKRLAADGRGLHTARINDNFAKLSEALYFAEQTSRDAVDIRSKLQTEIRNKVDSKHEENLQKIAAEANLDRYSS